MANDEESIDYQIRIEAANALKSLEDIMKTAANLPEAIQAVEQATQRLADEFGITFGAAQKEMQDTIKYAEATRAQIERVNEAGAEGLVTFSPYLEMISKVQSPFGEAGDVTGWKAVADQHRDISVYAKDEAKSLAEAAANQNKLTTLAAEESLNREKAITSIIAAIDLENELLAQQEAERQANLDIANEELLTVEREGAAIEEQIALYGQVARTQAESLAYLKSFSGTQKGKGILSAFFGSYEEAQTTGAQIDALKQGIIQLSQATGTTFAQAARVFNEQFSHIPGMVQQTSIAVRELNSDFGRVPEEAVRGIDAVRIALGAIVAMIVFNVIQAFGSLFKKIIEGAKEAELSIIGLQNAEQRLSDQGIGITPQDLQDIVDRLKELNPLLSDLERLDIVSTVASKAASALQLTAEQISQLSEVIAIFSIKNIQFGKSVEETTNDITNAILSGRVSQGINDMGIKITDLLVKQRAMKEENIQSAEAWNNLTAEQQNHAKATALINILYEQTKKETAGIPNVIDSIAGSSAELNKEWSNLTVTLGKIFGPVIIAGLKSFTQFLKDTLGLVIAIQKPLENMAATWSALMETMTQGHLNPSQVFSSPMLLAGILGSSTFLENFDKAKARFNDIGEAADTATASISDFGKEVEQTDFTEFINKLKEIQQHTSDAFADLRTKLLEKITDINTEYDRKAVDAETDYLRNIEDINRKYLQDIKDIKDKQRKQDIDDEAKYQLQLWELQQKYLMNLEDALHARDARQILRLQRQYAFDKEDLARKHALDNKNREEDQKDEIAAANKKKDQALADAKLAYDRKLADQRIAKERELSDLQTWYLRELRDLITAQERKMQELIKGWIEEQKITQQNAAAVYAILLKYFGPGGMTDALYQYMSRSLIANTANAVNALGQMIGSVGSMGGTVVGGGRSSGSTGSVGTRQPSTGAGNRGRAEGGTILANTPTNVTFGEDGAEAALFLPMNKIGRNSGSLDFSGNLGGGGMNGQIVVQLNLSPDLEARVVQNSMTGVANVLTKINRSKV